MVGCLGRPLSRVRNVLDAVRQHISVAGVSHPRLLPLAQGSNKLQTFVLFQKQIKHSEKFTKTANSVNSEIALETNSLVSGEEHSGLQKL